MEENNNIPTCMSASIGQLTAALSSFQGEIKQPKLNKEVSVKTKTGGSYKFKYADLGECIKAAAPGLQKNGLAVAQLVDNGYLVTILSHKSGEWMKSVLALGYEKLDGFQSLGSAITYLKRYSYCAILGIVADDDDDANFAEGNSATIKERKPAAAFTGAQLKQAIADIVATDTKEGYMKVWNSWKEKCPALLENGTEFYKVAANIINFIRESETK